MRNYCHVTGKYRGSVHTDCNLSYRLIIKIYDIFHNHRGYDSHKKLEKNNKDINVIPNNMEIYMAFMIDRNRNIYRFLSINEPKMVLTYKK